MASSANAISIQTGASVQAPQGKAHNKSPSGGDSFGDLLTQPGAPEEKEAVRTSAPAREARETKPAEKPAAEDKGAEKTQDTSAAADQTEAPRAEDAAEQDTRPAAGKTDIANDNDDADILALLPQQPEQPPQQSLQTGAPQPAIAVPAPAAEKPAAPKAEENASDTAEAGVIPTALNNAAPVQAAPGQTAPAQTAPQIPGDDKTVTGGVAPAAAGAMTEAADQAGKTKPVPAAETGDFKKALQETGSAPDAPPAPSTDAAKPETAQLPTAKPSPDLGNIALVPQTSSAASAAATHSAEKLAATPQAQIPQAPHGAPNVNQMAVEVAARSQSGAKQFDIRLDPPELGRVEVRLSIDAHGKAEAHLTADQPQTLDLLQKDAPALARALREAGLNVQQDGLNFSLKNQQQQNYAGGDDQSRHGTRGGFGGSKTSNETVPQDDGAYVRRGLGVLDIRV